MEQEHVRAGRDFGHCLVEPFNLPTEDTEGHGAVVTCSGSPRTALAELELYPGSPDPQAQDLSTTLDCFTGCCMTPQVCAVDCTLMPEQFSLLSITHLPLLPSSPLLGGRRESG
jgi:hypothetical protein